MSNPIITKALAAMNDENSKPWIPKTAKIDWEFINRALHFKHCLYVPKLACHDLVDRKSVV